MIYLIIAQAIGTVICFGFLIYLLNQHFKQKKNTVDFDKYESANEQISNYLYEILGMVGANRILLYKLMNGRVFLTKESEYKLVLTHEKLDDYRVTQSVLRTHTPQQVSTYGITYTDLRHFGNFAVAYSVHTTPEYYQKHFHFISEMVERNLEYAHLFYLKSMNDSTPFGMISIEFSQDNKAYSSIESAIYDIDIIVKKINLLLESINKK